MSATARHEREMIRKVEKELGQVTDPLEKLQMQCLKRGVTGIRDFGRTFRIWDDDGNRQLNVTEFSKGLRDYGVNLTPVEIESLFVQFDKDNSGSIIFDELLIALRPKLSKLRVDLIQAAFRKMDRSGDGFITTSDLKGVYSVKSHPQYVNGEKTEEELLNLFLNTFDSPEKDGKVSSDEFINYYSGVSASIDSDVYFDLMMRQAWKL